MGRDRVVALAIALLCMSAIGVSATTLESTVSQTPDDVIDFDTTQLPFGDQSTSDIDDQIQRNKQSQAVSADEDDGQASTSQSRQSDSEAREQRTDQSRSRDESQSSKDETDTTRTSEASDSLLRQLLDLLVELAPLLVALVALALVYRYRDRLLALLVAPLALLGRERSDAAPSATDPWGDAAPTDEIDWAWYAMVRRLDIDRPWTKTPAECRRAAVDAGLDPAAVETLTRLYREKRYRGDGLNDAGRARIDECIERLGLGRAAG